MKNERLVSIIIANYNGEKFLHTCLYSVMETNYPNFEVIIADDHSTDTSKEIINEIVAKDRRFQVLINEKNLGAAASRNIALSCAKGEIIIFLDNDTEVTPEWVKELVAAIINNNSGAAQSLLKDFHNREKIQNAGVKLWAATGWGLPVTSEDESSNEIIAISAALAVKKEVLDKIGGFDEKEALVTEDLDLSWRIWLAGYHIIIARQSIVYHWTKSIDMRKNMHHTNEKIYFHLTKNSLISIMKNYEIQNAIRYILESLIISILRALLVLIKRKDSSALSGTTRGIMFVLSNMTYVLAQRKKIQSLKKTTDVELFNTILVQGNMIHIYNKYFTGSKLV